MKKIGLKLMMRIGKVSTITKEKGTSKRIVKQVSPAFEDFVFNWDYEQYLLIGGYGSGKSYHIAFKLILACLQNRRKVLVVRQVFDTIYDSCYDLFKEILEGMDLLCDDYFEFKKTKMKVLAAKSPLRIKFPNGSEILFKGLDNPEKVKSINGVSIVWIEECSEVTPEAYKELLGRIRTPNISMHFILSCNPINRENWVYDQFFVHTDEKGFEHVIMDEEKFYEKKTVIKNGIYYHHSTPDVNPWLPWQYLKRLEDLKNYDFPLYMVARWGRFGASGTRVLPQLEVAKNSTSFKNAIERLGVKNQYFGFDFGFEESYNAVVSMSVDTENSILYIWDEIYANHLTDMEFAQHPKMQALRTRLDFYYSEGMYKQIVCDNEDPKAIKYYQQVGFLCRACRNKFAESRLSNTRKVKRFRKIIVSPKCKNVIKELQPLTYKKDRNGKTVYDQFNIDPHTFSAIWYALDTVTVADVKDKMFNSRKGGNWTRPNRKEYEIADYQ